jgi:PAS domain S-box-containing protein
MMKHWQAPAMKIALAYAGAGLVWIGVSDYVVAGLTGTPTGFTTVHTFKGCLFVVVTSVLLFLMVRRMLGTELKARTKAEETARALSESEEKFRRLAEAISEVFWISDLNCSKMLYVSPAYERLWGRSCESLYQNPKSWADAVHPEDREHVLAAMWVDRGLKEATAEYRIVRPDGSERWVLDRAYPLRNSAGEAVGVVGISKDISERKTAEAALREREHLYHTVFESASDGILLLEHGRCIDCNQRALEMFRLAREDLIGLEPAALFPERQPGDQRSAEGQYQRFEAALAGKPQSFQSRHQRRDGTQFVVEASLRAFAVGPRTLLLAVGRDITEHLRAEQALRESEEQLRALYMSMNEGLALHEMVYDAQGQAVDYRLIDVNPAFESITGLSRERAVGKLASAIFGSGSPPYLAHYAPVAALKGPFSFETYFPPMGKHFSISVFSPRKGQFATIFSDITKRKEAEQQICLLNKVYALISHVNEAIVRISDRDTLFQEACRIAVEHGQFPLAWIGLVDEAGREISPVAMAGSDKDYVAHIRVSAVPTSQGLGPVGTAVREGRVVICADIAKDSQLAPWRGAALARGYRSLIVLPLKTGERVVGAFAVYAGEPGFFTTMFTESLIEVAADLCFALNIFERNRQRELEQQQLRLQHSALEAAANAIMITDRNGTIQWVNDAFTRLTGYSRAEAVGQNPRLLKSGAHGHEFYSRLWQTVLSGSVWQGAQVNKRKDGTLYDEETTITPVRSQAGDITHFIAIKQDVTERRKLEQQFLRAQRMQSIGLLAGGVAHDLNNVLTPVLMALPLLRTPLEPAQRDHILQTLEQSVRRGANIVQQVLTFARGVEVQRVLVQLRHLVREVAKIAEETFPRDIRVRASLPSDLWPFLGDPTQIHQVLLNLAVNARDAMPDGGQLSFTAQNVELRQCLQFLDFEIRPGRYISFNVTDTGTGIPPEIIERMFEPFFTTKPAGKGTGLGLSTVLGIVKSHGGLVEVKSQVGAGSTFTVFLPAEAAQTQPGVSEEQAALCQGRGETILVVDDEAGILQVSKSILEANGYRVIAAKNGTQALARLSEPSHVIQAVVTDIMMPSMDGLALTRALRQSNPRLPVVAMTGLMNPPGEEDRAAQLRGLAVRHFLRKPFEAQELLSLINEALHPTDKAG